jgi:hypothetical protein
MIAIDRTAVVIEARSWMGTKYHRRAAIKSVGCDCGSFPAAVLANCGLLPADVVATMLSDAANLSDDWFMHAAEEKYLGIVGRYLPKLRDQMTYVNEFVEPGCIIIGKVFSKKNRNHAAVVTEWPMVMDCIYEGVREVNASLDPVWAHKEISVFDPFEAKC